MVMHRPLIGPFPRLDVQMSPLALLAAGVCCKGQGRERNQVHCHVSCALDDRVDSDCSLFLNSFGAKHVSAYMYGLDGQAPLFPQPSW